MKRSRACAMPWKKSWSMASRPISRYTGIWWLMRASAKAASISIIWKKAGHGQALSCRQYHVHPLNDKGITDILVVDNLKDGTKFVNLVDLNIADYMDKEDFLIQIMAGEDFGDIEAIFHEGACSSTTEWDGKYMMDNNYQYSKELLHYCLERELVPVRVLCRHRLWRSP